MAHFLEAISRADDPRGRGCRPLAVAAARGGSYRALALVSDLEGTVLSRPAQASARATGRLRARFPRSVNDGLRFDPLPYPGVVTPLRIALVHPFLLQNVRRGGERYLDDLSWYLVRAGHEVDVITGAEPGSPSAHGARIVQVRYPRSARFLPKGTTAVDTFGIAALPR